MQSVNRHFDKVLVANRGEIACRILRTCRRLGIRTVAVFSEADARAPHVRLADEAVFLGPSPAAESYLRIDALVDACKITGAQAVHPGCGFLSENPLFADALARDGIAFVGPPARVLRVMGDKLQAKALARQAGLPCIESSLAPIQCAADVRAFAQRVGYPVLIKACAGGGGKGIRLVRDASACDSLFDLCQSEAHRFFADATLMVEKALQAARHVEVQVLADSHGHVACFPERECSVQRRNQKVIEESPSPLFEAHPALRERALSLSRAMVRAADYVSVGTVEFMVTPHDGGLYFLEVNPRLQVEHTVTEMVTGVDLVEQMLRVAAGLPLSVDPVRVRSPRGHATEVRVLAEDTLRDGAPSVGRITEYVAPHVRGLDETSIRCDSGVDAGCAVSLYYDSLLCKVCAWGTDRTTSTDRVTAALDTLVLRGPQLNTGLAYRVLNSPEYRHGDLNTHMLDAVLATAPPPLTDSPRLQRVCQAVACLHYAQESALYSSATGDPLTSVTDYVVAACARAVDAQPACVRHQCQVRGLGSASRFECALAESPSAEMALERHPDSPVITATTVRATSTDSHVVFQYFGTTDGIVHSIAFEGHALEVSVCTPLQRVLLDAQREARAVRSPAPSPPDAVVFVRATMPSLLVEVCVRVGDRVQRGQPVATVEAMKMRSTLCAPVSGTVMQVPAAVGTTMKDGEVVLDIRPE